MKQPIDHKKINDALSGAISPDLLTAEEQEIFFSRFNDSMWNGPTPKQEAFYADRIEKGLGVGLDENDDLVYQDRN